MKKINVAIVGVGNCASSLVQGVTRYRHDFGRENHPPGITFREIGDYTIHDIDFVLAYDVDARKVGLPLSQAIYRGTNCCWETLREETLRNWTSLGLMDLLDPIVRRGPLFDGVADHMFADSPDDHEKFYVTDEDDLLVDYTTQLKENEVDVLLNYLPVGSEMATQFWARACLEAGVAMVNCIPSFIASDEKWARRFIKAGVPIVGDDMRSQMGASIISAALQELLYARGLDVELHYQDNIGGNTDFYNMQDQSRLSSKKISKENVINSQTELAGKTTKPNSVHAGPACYFPSLGDNKRASWLIKARGFGGAPVELTADLSVQDSPNSGGVVVDAIRLAQVAREKNIVGPLVGPSAFTQKTPPKDLPLSEARRECQEFARGKIPTGYVQNGEDNIFFVHRIYTE